MSTLENIKIKIAEINAKKEELVADLRKDFSPMLKPLFEKSNGKITSFGWTQYTPYFNDGDECTFGTNIDYPYVNGEYTDELETLQKGIYDEITEENHKEHQEFNSTPDGYSWYTSKNVGDMGYFRNPKYDIELFKLIEEFKELLSSIDDEFLKDLFGDHVLVTVHSDGRIETKEYEHD